MDADTPQEIDPYYLDFKDDPVIDIDRLALLAVQSYNLGDRGHWFLCFRGGCQGFHVRLFAVEHHFAQLHAWEQRYRSHLEPEYHLASIFFGLDSALECMLYAMNAMGYGAFPNEFVDITTDKGLRSIAPWMILGSAGRAPHPAFEAHYPEVTKVWRQHRAMIEEVQRQHDVSKHRSSTYRGGRSRNDPPPGFFETLGLPEGDPRRWDFAPMAEVILDPDPKRPAAAPSLEVKYEDLKTLEGLCREFVELIEQACEAWLRDARTMIQLNHPEFLRRYAVVGEVGIRLFSDHACLAPISGIQGIRVDHGHEGYPPERGRIVPACGAITYQVGDSLPTGGDYDPARTLGPAWHRDTSTGEAIRLWDSSAMFVSTPLPNGDVVGDSKASAEEHDA